MTTENDRIQLTAKRKGEPSVAGFLDELEKGLSQTLGEYRRGAEEVLLKHLEALEGMERAHQLEVSNLRAENSMLRDKLGLAKMAEPTMFQTVMFAQDPNANANTKQNKLKQAKTAAEKHRNLNSESDNNDKIVARKRNKNQSQEPGGSWQHFVCWVPNGSALKSPEPWKPLPQQVPEHPQKPNGLPPLLGVVPGVVQHVEENDLGGESVEAASVDGKVGEFEVLEIWKASKQALDKLRKTNQSVDGESRYTKELSTIGGDEEREFEEEPHAWWIIHPHCRARVVWDVFSLMMVIYDMITIPMEYFQLPEDDGFLVFMEWATRLFWTIDMIWSSFTAVVLGDGTVQFNHCYILKRYAKTWLLLDVIINGTDWTMTALSSSGAEFFSLARIFRIVRVVRLLRLVRMQEVLSTITERIQSDKLSFLLSMVKIMVFVLSTSHLIACLWWGLGARNSSGPTWVKDSNFDQAGLATKYLASLHWSLAQYTGGMDEITAVGPGERLFATVVWVFTFMASSFIVSSLTSNLTQLHIIGGARARQLATLRKYLSQNSVSSNLALRVQRSAQHAVNGELTQESVELLAVVSEPLKIEMHFAMYTGVVRSHPFFSDFIHEAPTVMRRICHYSMSTMLLISGDIIFSRGEELDEPKMYWVWKGHLNYVNPYSETLTLKEKQWIAEAALWTRWKHRGTLTAAHDAKLVCLDAKTFQEIANRHKYDAGFDPKLFAADFVESLNQQTTGIDDLTSLCMRP